MLGSIHPRPVRPARFALALRNMRRDPALADLCDETGRVETRVTGKRAAGPDVRLVRRQRAWDI